MGPLGNEAYASTSLEGSDALTDPKIIDASGRDLRLFSRLELANLHTDGAPDTEPADRSSASGGRSPKALQLFAGEVPAKTGCQLIGSTLPQPLISAYLMTCYQVDLEATSLELRVGAQSRELLDLYEREGCRSAAFITAWNPRGEELEDVENSLRHGALLGDVAARGLPFFTGEGRGDDSGWPPEKSLLVLGLPLEEAAQIGRRYEQNAIVWAADDATPVLMLLR